MAAKRQQRIDHPAYVTLLILTDADTGRRVAINSGWFVTFTEGDLGTTVFKFMNGGTLTVEEDFMTVVRAFAPQ